MISISSVISLECNGRFERSGIGIAFNSFTLCDKIDFEILIELHNNILRTFAIILINFFDLSFIHNNKIVSLFV